MTGSPAALDMSSLHSQPDETTSAETLRHYGRLVSGPNWRWRKAQRAVSRGHVSAHTEYGSEFWQIVDHLGGLPDGTHGTRRGDRLLDVAAAESIFHDPVLRLRVEARILARLPLDVVAARSDVAPHNVRDYCDIFFDVLDCLDSKSWLACHVIDGGNKSVSNLHNVVCRDSCWGGSAVCEHWLARIPYLDEECDLTTSRGREIKRLQLALKLYQLEREDRNHLNEIAARLGGLLSRPSLTFVSLGHALGQRTAHQLGKFLPHEEDALQTVQIADDSHTEVGRIKLSA